MALCPFWDLLVLSLHPVCSSVLPFEMKEQSWEAQLYVNKGEHTFFLWLAVNHLKIRLWMFEIGCACEREELPGGFSHGGQKGGAKGVPYWTVLYAKSSLDLSPGKEYITVRNSYMPLEN